MSDLTHFLAELPLLDLESSRAEAWASDAMALEKRLMAEPDFCAWLNSQPIPPDANHLKPIHVAWWLIERSVKVGIKQSCAELTACLTAPPEGPTDTMLFESLFFTSSDEADPFEFSNGLTFTCLERLDGYRLPGIHEFPLHCLLIDKTGAAKDFTGKCLDLCRCLSLARGADQSVQPKFFTSAWREDAPHPRTSHRGVVRRHRAGLVPPMVRAELTRANDWLEKLKMLGDKSGKQARMVLDHWSAASSDIPITESAVHLRICLEAVLMDNDRGDNTFKIATRGALMLGGDLTERKSNRASLKKAYDAGSNAVHGGDLKQGDLDAWGATQRVVRSVVSKWLESGALRLGGAGWQSVELGEDYPPRCDA